MAFSGGVDSSLLYFAAREAVGEANVLVLRGLSELVSHREREGAGNMLDALGVAADRRVELTLRPLLWPEFVVNSADRCYLCKKRMYTAFLAELKKLGSMPLLDGTNVDDLQEERPGLRAIHELSIQTPLLDAGLEKEEIRNLACQFQLLNHDKPSNSCLATRFPQETPITHERLQLVEKCEDFLLGLNFSGCRVRPRNGEVILEVVEKDMARLAASPVRGEIIGFMRDSGFARVLLNLRTRR